MGELLPPEGLGTLLRSLIAHLDEAVEAASSQVSPAMRPRFYPVMRCLLQCDTLGVGALASAVGVTQPAMTQTVGQMHRVGLVEVEPGADRRQRIIRLSEAGRQAAERLRPLWQAIAEAARELDCETAEPLSDIVRQALQALEDKSFGARIAEHRRKEC